MPAHALDHDILASAVRDGIARAVAIVGLAGVALIHLLDLPGTFDEQAYKGWLYLGLIAGTLLAAAALIRSSDRRAWLAVALLPLGAMAGYVWSRTIRSGPKSIVRESASRPLAASATSNPS